MKRPLNHPDYRITQLSEDSCLLRFTPAEEQLPSAELQQRICNFALRLQENSRELQLLEVVPGVGNLLLQFLPLCSLDAIQRQQGMLKKIEGHWAQTEDAPISGKTIDIPVHYGGELGADLEALARTCALSPDEVIHLHTAPIYSVYCIGFQPGFAYMGGLDARIHCPRKHTPSTKVPAGAVAIGGAQTGIYPFASPGGWHVIGHTDIELFNPQKSPASTLQAGDKVRFVKALS
ncbi:MAG: 5-oxoprolinase subunit PxpB [Pseudohongiellaceae bacterium]|nr:5-oxoprolinase subunit PxpB [Pseudohongiellaceae bacterium]